MEKVAALLLTCVQRVTNFSITAHVLVQGLDPDDLGACRHMVGDAGLVAGT